MTDDQLNRLCAEAMALLETGTWSVVYTLHNDGDEVDVRGMFEHKDGGEEELALFACSDENDIAQMLAEYVVAAQPVHVIAMIRRIRELEYEVAKAEYKKACAWVVEAREWGSSDVEMAEAESDAESAKKRVDDAAARLSAVGGKP